LLHNEEVNCTDPELLFILKTIVTFATKSHLNEEVNCTDPELLFIFKTILTFATKSHYNEEVNRTEPSPSVSFPCNVR
jgi:hypothetical protein